MTEFSNFRWNSRTVSQSTAVEVRAYVHQSLSIVHPSSAKTWKTSYRYRLVVFEDLIPKRWAPLRRKIPRDCAQRPQQRESKHSGRDKLPLLQLLSRLADQPLSVTLLCLRLLPVARVNIGNYIQRFFAAPLQRHCGSACTFDFFHYMSSVMVAMNDTTCRHGSPKHRLCLCSRCLSVDLEHQALKKNEQKPDELRSARTSRLSEKGRSRSGNRTHRLQFRQKKGIPPRVVYPACLVLTHQHPQVPSEACPPFNLRQKGYTIL